MMKTKALPKTKKKKAPKGQGFKLEAKPLTEQQIKDFVAHYNKYKSFPGSKIPCTISGKLTTCVGPWMVKKIKEFGGPEQLLRNYKCRGVLKKQVVKPVSAKAAKRKKLQEIKDENKNWDLPKVDLNSVPRPLSNDELGEVTKSTCLRPDIFLDNDRACDGCEFFDVCNNSLKCLKKITKRRK